MINNILSGKKRGQGRKGAIIHCLPPRPPSAAGRSAATCASAPARSPSARPSRPARTDCPWRCSVSPPSSPTGIDRVELREPVVGPQARPRRERHLGQRRRAAPRPRLGPLAQPGPQRIRLDVLSDAAEVRPVGDRERLEPSLVQMSAAAGVVVLVMTADVRDADPRQRRPKAAPRPARPAAGASGWASGRTRTTRPLAGATPRPARGRTRRSRPGLWKIVARPLPRFIAW